MMSTGMSVSKYATLAFLCGLVFGIGMTVMVSYYIFSDQTDAVMINALQPYMDDEQIVQAYNKLMMNSTRNVSTTSASFLHDDKDDNTTAEQLYNKVRVLCWIMTSPSTMKKKAIHVKETWSSRCNVRLFMSSVEDRDFPAVGLSVKEGRDQLYEKTKASFKYAYQHYKDQVDWFLKADDDTFVVVENLRYLLKDYDANTPIYFGRKFKPYVNQGYMSGGAGYVLSKEATKRFVDGMNTKCARGGGVEDVEIGKCMSNLGVAAGDSRDYKHKETFHPLSPEHHVVAGKLPKDFWYWKYNYYQSCSGKGCSSEYPISFHYVNPDNMYILEYMIYDVKVYGMAHGYRRYLKLPYEVS